MRRLSNLFPHLTARAGPCHHASIPSLGLRGFIVSYSPLPYHASTQLAENSKFDFFEMHNLVRSLGGLRRYGEMRDLWKRNGGAKVRCM